MLSVEIEKGTVLTKLVGVRRAVHGRFVVTKQNNEAMAY